MIGKTCKQTHQIATWSHDIDQLSCHSMNNILNPIIEKAMPLVGRYRNGLSKIRPVIAIAGCSAVGKSTFAEYLNVQLQNLRVKSSILHFDDFLEPNNVEDALNDVHPHFDHRTAHSFLQQMKRGHDLIEKKSWMKTSDGEDCKIRSIYDLKNVELVIFEGEFTLCDENTYGFLEYSDIKIILECDDIEQVIAWDLERGRPETKQMTCDQFFEQRRASLQRYLVLLDSLKKYADLIIKKGPGHTYFAE